MDGPLQCSWFDGLRPQSSFPQITIHADGGSLCAVTGYQGKYSISN